MPLDQEEELFRIINTQNANSEKVGVTLTWKDTGIGGAFHIWKPGEICFLLTINRKRAHYSKDITDVNWYLEKVLPVLEKSGLHPYLFRWEEIE